MPGDYRIGRLNGRFVVTWWGDDGKRRRYRLDAQSRTEAEGAALDLIRRERSKAAGATVAEGFHQGPRADQVEDPTLVGPIMAELLAKARPNADINGQDIKPAAK